MISERQALSCIWKVLLKPGARSFEITIPQDQGHLSDVTIKYEGVAHESPRLMTSWSNVARAAISEVFPAFTPPVTVMLHRPRTTAARNAAVT